jgi:hypothetical protein
MAKMMMTNSHGEIPAPKGYPQSYFDIKEVLAFPKGEIKIRNSHYYISYVLNLKIVKKK